MSENGHNVISAPNPDEQANGSEWSILEELSDEPYSVDIFVDYSKDCIKKAIESFDNIGNTPAINEGDLLQMVEATKDPESAKKLKESVIKGIRDTFNENEEGAADGYSDDEIFDCYSCVMALKSIYNRDAESPEEYVNNTKKLLANLGCEMPISPEKSIGIFGDGYKREDIETRNALENAGYIDKNYRHMIFDKTINRIVKPEQREKMPQVLFDPTDELYDYWDEQSRAMGGDAFRTIFYRFYDNKNFDYLLEDGTLSEAAFADDSPLVKTVFKRYVDGHARKTEKAERIGLFNIIKDHRELVSGNLPRIMIDAMDDIEDDDIANMLDFSYKIYADEKYYGGNDFDEDGNPNEYFWSRLFDFKDAKYVKQFKGYESFFSESDIAFIDLPNEKRSAIMNYIKSMPFGEAKEKAKERGRALGLIDVDGNLNSDFYSNDILGQLEAENVASVFKEQSKEHLSEKEIGYCELPEQYREVLIKHYARHIEKQRANGEEVETYVEYVNKIMDNDGPNAEMYRSIFEEGGFNLLTKEPLVSIEETGLSDIELETLEVYDSIKDEKLETEYTNFILEGIKNNYSIPLNRIMTAPQVLKRLIESNASEIVAHRAAIARQLLRVDLDDDEKMFTKLDEVDDIFVRNGLPMAGKSWAVFTILHATDRLAQDFNINDDNKKMSPGLKEEAKKGGLAGLIYRDLVKSYLGSSIQTARYMDILKTRYPDLDTGFEGIDDSVEYSKKTIETAHKRNIETSRHNLVLEKGDLVKGVGGMRYLGTILKNGSNAREFLGEGADSDATPLDTDMSQVFTGPEKSVRENFDELECHSYGPIYFVLKDKRDGQERFQTTRRSPVEEDAIVDEVDTKSDKLEAFYTGALGNHHYGIRTGFASSEVDAIVVEKENFLKSEVGLEIALNGFYIPVYDMDGKCVFTPEDYEEIRKKMSGLEYYEGISSIESGAEYSGNSLYSFAEDLSIPGFDLSDIIESISEARTETDNRHKAIDAVFKQAFEGINLNRKDYIDGNLQPGSIEVADTGSTGRGTNVPHDGDYDYMFRLDRADFNNPARLDEIRNVFVKALGKENLGSEDVSSENLVRLKHVKIPGIDEEIDVDITMEQKTNRLRYSTDESLRRRIAAMRMEDPVKTDQVIANIIFAKKFCKAVDAYKPKRTRDYPDDKKGGLGGVGVENWILQNGGSFVNAAKQLVELAKNDDGSVKDFGRFKEICQIFDFGENHMAGDNENMHDNFVSRNMSEGGYERLITALVRYVEDGELPKALVN